MTDELVPNLQPSKEAAQQALERAVGQGRLTLDQFTERVDLVWQAESLAELEKATSGLPAPIEDATVVVVGSVRHSVFDDVKRKGRFALRSGTTVSSVFGDVRLDLRDAVITESVVDITGSTFFGDVKVVVPEGVQVEVESSLFFGAEKIRVAEVPRIPGSPIIRLRARTFFGDVKVSTKR
ncbi:DUF1707 domain-containing protein [Allokutzneria sp. NRRL B-24872]|uniref:DUF1707 SHOCT-like domain-containing protein n=1 Tax=Allokutzneria sp. NRRL B-24872 TaxID=1137961 RepID=UPI00143DDE98|nr:LiaF domain-containing protein [Allokutzneria sp. NRRL B-24872]